VNAVHPPGPASPAPILISKADIAAECLRRNADREMAAVRGVLLGMGFMVVVHWHRSTLEWVLMALALRFAALM
jgi:hypothetical protein